MRNQENGTPFIRNASRKFTNNDLKWRKKMKYTQHLFITNNSKSHTEKFIQIVLSASAIQSQIYTHTKKNIITMKHSILTKQ